MNSPIPEVDADSVKKMIDSSRLSKASTVFDISFSNVKNNWTIDSAPGELDIFDIIKTNLTINRYV